MTVVVEKPYRFVPPHRGDLWPSMIQRLRLVDIYLRRKDGVVGYECRHAERLKQSIDQGHGILLAPNHCRYADPLVLGWLSRAVDRHVFAMASWHLFNKSRLERFSMPKMGAFSIWREGRDRQSLETAIDILVEARRPLIVFPEGTTNRTNDVLQPLLDGVLFMARTAQRRRAKQDGGKVVIHPVGIKYLFRGDIVSWADTRLEVLERRLSWQPAAGLPLLVRIARVAEALLSLKEVEYLGRVQGGSLHQRRDRLVEALLEPVERELVGPPADDHVLNRVRACRGKIVPRLLDPDSHEETRQALRRWVVRVELAQQLISYPQDYLSPAHATDTRILETIERMHEDFLGKSCSPAPLHAVIEVEPAIEVTGEKPPREGADPLLEELRDRLSRMLARLGREARPLDDFQPANTGTLSSVSTVVASTDGASYSSESREVVADARSSL